MILADGVSVNSIFGASIQVIALIGALVCLISAILDKSFGIGPIKIPAPMDLMPRVALTILGSFLFILAFWSSFSGKTIVESIADIFSPKGFAKDNRAFVELLRRPETVPSGASPMAEVLYANYTSPEDHCQIVEELIDRYGVNVVPALPQGALNDAESFAGGSNDGNGLGRFCRPQLIKISISTKLFVQTVATRSTPATPRPVQSSVDVGTVTSRPTPVIATVASFSTDAVRRALTAVTRVGDEGWLFLGRRNRSQPRLIANSRVGTVDIPRSGMISTIADSVLLTSDPGISTPEVKGYVLAGSSVDVLDIAGPRHFTKGAFDGYDVYAKARVISTPEQSLSAPAPSTSASPSSPLAGATALPVPPTALADAKPNPSSLTGCFSLPTPSSNLFEYCNETFPVIFGSHKLMVYKVTDSHSTGIHFRNIGMTRVLLSIYPTCQISAACPTLRGVSLPAVKDSNDGSNDFIYKANTLEPFNFGWSVLLDSARKSP